jgi:hypothetical protein
MWAGYWSNRVIAMKRAGIAVTTRQLRYRKENVLDAAGNPVLEADGSPKVVTTLKKKVSTFAWHWIWFRWPESSNSMWL